MTLSARIHPAPIFTARKVTDDLSAIPPIIPTPGGDYVNYTFMDWSHVRQAQPLYSRSSKTYHATTINVPPSVNLFGQIVSITIAVTGAYTGSFNPLIWDLFGQFGGRVVYPDGSSSPFWFPQIDLRTPGSRVISPGGSDPARGSDANLIMPANPLWLTGDFQPYLSHNISAEAAGDTNFAPHVTVSFVLDQSAMAMTEVATPPTAVMPFVRLRLHA